MCWCVIQPSAGPHGKPKNPLTTMRCCLIDWCHGVEEVRLCYRAGPGARPGPLCGAQSPGRAAATAAHHVQRGSRARRLPHVREGVRPAGRGGRLPGRYPDRRGIGGDAQAARQRPGHGGLRPGRHPRGRAHGRGALPRKPLLRAGVAVSPEEAEPPPPHRPPRPPGPGRGRRQRHPAAGAAAYPVMGRFLRKPGGAVHFRPGLSEPPTASPSDGFVELPLPEVARRSLRRGPPFLERFLPFWIAVTVERWALLLLPAVGLLLPLIRILPSLYNSRMRRRVTRWYRAVHEVDHSISRCTPDEARAAAERLRGVQAEILKMSPPPQGLMGELYDLKLHMEWLLARADAQAAKRHSPR